MNSMPEMTADKDVSNGALSISEFPERETGWSRTEIARLSPAQISFLPEETLAEVIAGACDCLPQPDVCDRLCYLDRESLERLVYLVRQSCRRQGNGY